MMTRIGPHILLALLLIWLALVVGPAYRHPAVSLPLTTLRLCS